MRSTTRPRLACQAALAALWLSAGVVAAGRAHGAVDAPEEARGILQTYCFGCHGQDGRDEGGFNDATDLLRLVSSKRVVPMKPAESRLFRMISDGVMPPRSDRDDARGAAEALPRPTAEQVAVLRAWIEAGARPPAGAAPARSFVSDDELLSAVSEGLNQLSPRDRRHARFFTIAHLANAGRNGDQLQSYRLGLAKLVNGLSWRRGIALPVPVDAAGTVLRIDLRDYGWTPDTWNTIVSFYPYSVRHKGAKAEAIASSTRSEQPLVRGDWFLFAASRPPLYDQVLRLPATEKALAARTNVDVVADIRQDRVARAGFNGSGVSRNNRVIERHESSFGAYWRTYDFASGTDRRNVLTHPLGPAGEGAGPLAFQHDGGEVLFHLPNGLLAYMTLDAAGNRIDRGPATLVRDPKRPDGAVVTGVSCMGCHGRGLVDKVDEVRPLSEKPGSFAREPAEAIVALYPPRPAWEALLREDNQRYARAVLATGAALSRTEPVHALAQRYEADLDLPLAAAEAGETPDAFRDLLNKTPRLRQMIGPLLADGIIKRDVFVAAVPHIAEARHLEFHPATGAPAPATATATAEAAAEPLIGAEEPAAGKAGKAAEPLIGESKAPARTGKKASSGEPLVLVELPRSFDHDARYFRDIAPRNGYLVGVTVTFNKFFDLQTIGSLQPIYRVGGKLVRGRQHGTMDRPEYPPVTITAKPGYAVGLIHTRAGLNFDGLDLVFMRIKEDQLDPTNNYMSPWVGATTGGGPGVIDPGGRPIVGLHGRGEQVINQLGVLVAE